MKTRIATHLLTATLSLALAGCATMASIRTAHDEFEKTDITTLHANALPFGLLDNGTIYLNAQMEGRGTARTFYLIVSYIPAGYGILLTMPGESLILLIDGERVALTKTSVLRDQSGFGGGVFYATDESTIRKLAKAKELKVRIVAQVVVDKVASKTNLANFSKFAARVMHATELGTDAAAGGKAKLPEVEENKRPK